MYGVEHLLFTELRPYWVCWSQKGGEEERNNTKAMFARLAAL